MSRVLSIEDMRFDEDVLVVEAVVEDAVQTHHATQEDPAEWAPALCRGSMLFSDETLIPATDHEFLVMLSEQVDDWAPVDQSDLYE